MKRQISLTDPAMSVFPVLGSRVGLAISKSTRDPRTGNTLMAGSAYSAESVFQLTVCQPDDSWKRTAGFLDSKRRAPLPAGADVVLVRNDQKGPGGGVLVGVGCPGEQGGDGKAAFSNRHGAVHGFTLCWQSLPWWHSSSTRGCCFGEPRHLRWQDRRFRF